MTSMLKLNSLTVSLTKHGAHKIADLLKEYSADQVLENLTGIEPGINIDEAQARSNLSVASTGVVPPVWDRAQKAGHASIDGLVLIAIIFSHYRLIQAMRVGKTDEMRGTIKRGVVLDGKAFTNFAHVIEQLGYSMSHSPETVKYDLKKMLSVNGLNRLTLELLATKFRSSVWDGSKPLIDELIANHLNEVFALSPEKFRNWLISGDVDVSGTAVEDAAFFLDTGLEADTGSFHFTPGHSPKKTGTVAVTSSSSEGKATLLHNELQTALYDTLAGKYGADYVGTEQDTGHGTWIDLVVKTGAFCWFYEIKVAPTLLACVRQAIPQLLEYAFWKQDGLKVDRLYIASKFEPTPDVLEYLKNLRDRFKVPFYYEQIKT
jgi:hypothetical protein